MRYNRQRRDHNQQAIINALRSVGAKVKDTSQIGSFVDLVVSFRGAVFLLEVKRNDVSPSQKKLTPAEQRFHDEWGDVARIVETPEEALITIGARVKII